MKDGLAVFDATDENDLALPIAIAVSRACRNTHIDKEGEDRSHPILRCLTVGSGTEVFKPIDVVRGISEST